MIKPEQKRLLEIVKEVSEGKTLTQCAKEHNVSTSTLSSQIEGVEGQLGQRLFLRNKKRMIPTDFAKETLRDIETILECLERIDVRAKEMSKVERIRYATPKIIVGDLYHKVFDYMRNHPEYDLTETKDDGQDPEGMIARGEVDCAFIGNPSHKERYSHLLLLHDHVGILVHPSHPLANKSEVGLNELNEGHIAMGKEACRYVLNLKEEVYLGGKPVPFNAYKSFVQHKEIVLTFRLAADMLGDTRQVFIPIKDLPVHQIYFCWRHEKDDSPLMMDLALIIEEHFHERP